ncbi:MAG: hypothetical protein J1G01_03610 [Clostridiales bacterium]|nr:hypothetical protein [Clostridiales bacterium]
MTLFDCNTESAGVVGAIRGDLETHRRLVDMGLLGVEYLVRAKKKQSLLSDFGSQFSAVVQSSVAEQIEVIENRP